MENSPRESTTVRHLPFYARLLCHMTAKIRFRIFKYVCYFPQNGVFFIKDKSTPLVLEAYHHQTRKQLQRHEPKRLVSSSSRKTETQPLFDSVAPPLSHSRMLIASKRARLLFTMQFCCSGGGKVAF